MKSVSFVLTLLTLAGAACTGESLDAGQLAAEPTKPGEQPAAYADAEGKSQGPETTVVSVSQQSLVDNTYAVGVIPTNQDGPNWGSTCPAGSEYVRIRMDDEDDDNNTFWNEWQLPQAGRDVTTGRCLSGSLGLGLWGDLGTGCNTTMGFCKVDGKKFRPITSDVNQTYQFYAVLKLGQYCPNGSIEFSRLIDNEDDDNNNSYSGPTAPNLVNGNTRLYFCMFRTGSTKMTAFPSLGVPYAVFHDYDGIQPPWVIKKRYARSDDEDDDNATRTTPDTTSAFFDFDKIVGGSVNTMFDMARVK
jgi:hypothetical protein